MNRRHFLGAVPFLAAAATAPNQQWSVITIGNLSRNRYWGEPDDKAFRSVICTSTLISGDGFRLLVDPSCSAKDDMARELDRRTGLKLDNITAIFITHEHADHVAGLEHFQKATWYAGAPVAEILNADKKFTRKIEPAPSTLFGSIEVIPTPGHTQGHHSLRFDSGGKSIVVAGDAVATADFWRERRAFYNAVDAALARKTMDHLAKIAAIIIPGHDNYILV